MLGIGYLTYVFRVAQDRRFVTNPICAGGGAMVAKTLDFRLSERLKMRSPGPFAIPNYLWKVGIFRENFLLYPPNITCVKVFKVL